MKDLVIYASGDSKAIRKLRPLFAGFSRAVHDLGTFGNGSRMKYVANLLVAINNVASAEAMVLGLKAGLDAADDLRDGAIGRRQFARVRVARADDGEGRYDDATMKMSVWQKDMAVIGEFAQADRLPDADVRRHRADLQQGDEDRPRRARHRRGLRGAGEDGRREAREGEAARESGRRTPSSSNAAIRWLDERLAPAASPTALAGEGSMHARFDALATDTLRNRQRRNAAVTLTSAE